MRDLAGSIVGRLTVIRLASGNTAMNARWIARCSCGTEKEFSYFSLAYGRSKSCGCLRKEVSSERARKHGMARTKEWTAWLNMKQRVTNPKDISYARYKARGITIFEPWINSFEEFFAEIGPAPSSVGGERFSVYRINNDLGYEPGNVRWASHRTQANNRSNNVVFEIGGDRLTARQISDQYGIPHATLLNRLRLGWPIDRCVSQPIRAQRNNIKIKGAACTRV